MLVACIPTMAETFSYLALLAVDIMISSVAVHTYSIPRIACAEPHEGLQRLVGRISAWLQLSVVRS